MQYTVCLLFTPDGENVLMQMKDRTSFAGKLNGVGGKLNAYESPAHCASREIQEETGAIIAPKDLVWLFTLTLPEDCASDDPGVTCTLYFFAGITEKEYVGPQEGETEPLMWVPPKKLDAEPELFADVGNLQYALHRAQKYYDFDKLKRTKFRYRPGQIR